MKLLIMGHVEYMWPIQSQVELVYLWQWPTIHCMRVKLSIFLLCQKSLGYYVKIKFLL